MIAAGYCEDGLSRYWSGIWWSEAFTFPPKGSLLPCWVILTAPTWYGGDRTGCSRNEAGGAMRESDALLSCTEAAHIDAVTREELGIPGLVLMENAGRAVWDAIRSRTSGPLVICAGPGNNGGDALVVARWAMMREDRDVQIITTRASLGEQATVQWKILEAMGATRRIWNDDHRGCRSALASEGWIVDGISGTGVAGALRGDAAQVVAAINESSAPVASIDVPSGARDGYNPGDPLVRADLTVVTGYRKRVLYIPAVRAAAGEIEQVDPGFPPTVLRRIAAAGSPPARLGDIYSVSPGVEPVTPDAHKGGPSEAVAEWFASAVGPPPREGMTHYRSNRL